MLELAAESCFSNDVKKQLYFSAVHARMHAHMNIIQFRNDCSLRLHVFLQATHLRSITTRINYCFFGVDPFALHTLQLGRTVRELLCNVTILSCRVYKWNAYLCAYLSEGLKSRN